MESQEPDRLEPKTEVVEPSSRWATMRLAAPAIPVLLLLLASGYLSLAELTAGLVVMFGMLPGVIMRLAMSLRHSSANYRRLRRMSLPATILALASLAIFVVGAVGVGTHIWVWGIELLGAIVGWFWWGWVSPATIKSSGPAQ